MYTKFMMTFVTAAVIAVIPAISTAAETVLRAVSAFQEGSDVTRNFERFVNTANSEGKGKIRVNFLGGPKVMPPFEVGKAVKTGVVDMAFVTGAYYTNIMPEALSLSYTDLTGEQQRSSGALDVINDIWSKKMNVFYLARGYDHQPYHIYLNKKIDKLDLTGLRIRVTPAHHDIAVKLGAIAVTLPPGEVFGALERGLIDGYIYSVLGIFDLGWQEKTMYRVEPGFYNSEIGVLVNLDKWKSLSPEQQGFLKKQAESLEKMGKDYIKINENEKQRQAAAGIKPLAFSGKEADDFLKRANDVAWDSVVSKNPATGRQLKEKLAK